MPRRTGCAEAGQRASLRSRARHDGRGFRDERRCIRTVSLRARRRRRRACPRRGLGHARGRGPEHQSWHPAALRAPGDGGRAAPGPAAHEPRFGTCRPVPAGCRRRLPRHRAGRPGGLGTSPEADVRQQPHIGLRAAMRLAADRDLIARQYANGFAEIFDIGVPLAVGRRMETAAQDVFLALRRRCPTAMSPASSATRRRQV